jgi:integrase
MLNPYRRHLKSCPHAKKGRAFSLCGCPIWCDGMVNGVRIGRSLQTNVWERALRRIQVIMIGDHPTAGVEPASAPAPAVLDLARAIELFLADGASRNLNPGTLYNYRLALDSLKAQLPASPLSSVTLGSLDLWRLERKVEPGTLRKEIQILRTFFNWCTEREWIARSPAGKLRKPLVDGIATLPFEEDEIERLLAACEKISSNDPAATTYIRRRARAMLYALLYSGLRISDVAILRRRALDEASGHLTLRTEKTGVPLKVKLHIDAVRALITLPAKNPEYFFWTGRGNPRRCAKNMWRTICRLGAIAGVKNARPHRFRDTFSHRLLDQGTDMRTLQKLLGHKSILTTERHYAHFLQAQQALLDAATAKLDFTSKAARPLLVHPFEYRRRNAE